jgi:lauroyl/myristoyl acyltransferase
VPADRADPLFPGLNRTDGGRLTPAVVRLVDGLARCALDVALSPRIPEAILESMAKLPAARRNLFVREAFAAQWRARCLDMFLKVGGVEAVSGSIRIGDISVLRRLREKGSAAVLLFGHVGPRGGLIAALARLGIPLFMMVPTPTFRVPERIQFLPAPDAGGRALGFKLAVDRIRDGGWVAMPADGTLGSNLIETECLGRRVRVARGPAVMARLVDAPLVPVAVEWKRPGWDIEFRAFEPLARPEIDPRNTDDYDRALLTAALEFFKKFVRADPMQHRPGRAMGMSRSAVEQGRP